MRSLILFVASILATCWLQAETTLPAKEDFHVFILAGQSNMAGRGDLPEVQTTGPQILMLNKKGKWVPAKHPIHYDKNVAGVGLGKTFAEDYLAAHPEATVGLVPTACGGSSVTKWVPGGYHEQTKSNPYDDAIVRSDRALQDGTLKGILWHQGEADCKSPRAEEYKKNLTELINRFREHFGDDHLPFIIGQLGQFEARPWKEGTHQVDEAHKSLAEEMDNVAFVSSDGLSSKPDNVHFDTPSQEEFGHRYAKAYLKMEKE